MIENQILGKKIGHIVLDQPASLNISTDWDMEIAQFYAAKLIEMSEDELERLLEEEAAKKKEDSWEMKLYKILDKRKTDRDEGREP